MSVSPQIQLTPKFTDMEEMKRWQAEREDQLHREQVREKLAAHDRVETATEIKVIEQKKFK